MNLKIDDHLSLGYFLPGDVIPVSRYLNDIEVYNNTLRIPHPYTVKDAEDWVASNIDKQMNESVIRNYTIRWNGNIIGSIGFMPRSNAESHTTEIGYWLAKEYRGQGIMTKVAGFFCDLIFRELAYIKIIAHAYPENFASQAVLEKNGFVKEGYLSNHFHKEGRYIDCILYGKLKKSDTNV